MPTLAAATLIATAVSAAAQPSRGPSPGEQIGMHTGTNVTNGSAVLVTDRYGAHPEGYPGFRATFGGTDDRDLRRHHRHHRMRHSGDAWLR